MGMRPWEREQADAAAGSPMTPSPPRPSKTSLSSMVVRASDNEGGGSGGEDDKGAGTGREKEVRQQKGEESPPTPAEAHRDRSERFPEDADFNSMPNSSWNLALHFQVSCSEFKSVHS